FLLSPPLPQPAQTHHRSQLQRLRALVVSRLHGLTEALLHFVSKPRSQLPSSRLQRQLASEPMQLRLPPALAGLVRGCERLGKQGAPLLGLPELAICLGQQGEVVRPHDLCARGQPRGETPAHERGSFLSSSLDGERPAAQEGGLRQEERK